MDYKRVFRSQFTQDSRHRLRKCGIKNSKELPFGPSGIGQWSEDVENSSNTKIAPHGSGKFHCPMHQGGKEKGYSHFVQYSTNLVNGKVDIDSQCLQDISASTFARNRPVPMLGND